MASRQRIVGIGASAGGVEALKGFFQHVPPDSGLGFVVVLHLSPDRASMLADVLGRWTSMPVTQATDGVVVTPDHVYVIPPAMLMTFHDGMLRLHSPKSTVRESPPIDVLFSSMAEALGPDAVGVVLSGTGSDGALGLKAIKEYGGVAVAQGGDGTGPQYNGMPSSAIATGAVDLILPVESMPHRIIGLAAKPALPPDDTDVALPTVAEQIAEQRPAICGLLRNQVGHDFTGYKRQTFIRRVHRRMQFIGLGLTGYVSRLREDPAEVVLLFHDLLIGVTSFFRNRETFEAVTQTVLPRIFAGKTEEHTVRVWAPGCATGEEAYSLAIVMREYQMTLATQPKIQIFATDIDDAAIAVARTGRYPALLMKDVSRERLDRFFVASDTSYLVTKEIRDLCTFSAHSVIRDPPFSRIDLISCRNLLIYLDAPLQGHVIPAFHYSLVPGGMLLLGGSETVTRHTDLFAPVDTKHRIYQRRNMPTPPLQVSSIPPLGHLVHTITPRPHDLVRGWADAAQSANERVLERFSPPFVVVNAEGDALHFSGRTGLFLEPPAGMPTRNVAAMARRGLRMELRAALRKAQETGSLVERANVQVETDGGVRTVTLFVEPISGRDNDRLFMVVFADQDRAKDPIANAAELPAHEVTLDQTERELRDVREQLQSTAEEYETALEEVKSANEELHSVNEELQSANEELETSKEEIQSMNEELQTVNAQLVAKVEELDRAGSDLRNLFDSTQVATIFLDRFMVIRSFTPAVGSIYNLIPSDDGRPLTDIVSQIDYSDLRHDVRRVLDTLEPFERRVARLDGTLHYLVRILPYRAANNQVDGALITFIDVTSIVQAEQHHKGPSGNNRIGLVLEGHWPIRTRDR